MRLQSQRIRLQVLKFDLARIVDKNQVQPKAYGVNSLLKVKDFTFTLLFQAMEMAKS